MVCLIHLFLHRDVWMDFYLASPLKCMCVVTKNMIPVKYFNYSWKGFNVQFQLERICHMYEFTMYNLLLLHSESKWEKQVPDPNNSKVSKISYCHVALSLIHQNKNHISNLQIIQWSWNDVTRAILVFSVFPSLVERDHEIYWKTYWLNAWFQFFSNQ